MKLEIGDKAPLFNLPDQEGNKHKLSDYKEQWILLYFYPKDNTPGCTIEACSIRDIYPNFKKLKIKVFGVSKDSVKSHSGFAEKHKLPFTLLSDESTEMMQKYGVWQKKKMMGREYMGTVRMSFLIDPKGSVAKIYPKVNPLKHAEEVLEDLKELMKK